MTLLRPPEREYRTWILDSRRWAHYRPRPGDVIVAAYPKTGSTWLQRIISLILFQSAHPIPIDSVFPWIDRRFPVPIDKMMDDLESQQHRRSLKSHLPLDGLPIFDEVKYIHIARDGRDVCMSYHNHVANFSAAALEQLDEQGLVDETFGRPYPRAPSDPAEFFRIWLREGVVPGHSDGSPTVSFFGLERSYWAERNRPNFLLLHYNDLKADVPGEMRRIADFLEIKVHSGLWPKLIEAASFEAMRRDALKIVPHMMGLFQKGPETFFFKATSGRWREALCQQDVDNYEAKVRASLSPACANWVEHGRSGGADPSALPN